MKEHYILIPFLILLLPILVIQITGKTYWKDESFHYSQRTAKLDITNGTIKVVTFDKKRYHLNQKYKYTSKLGFEYVLESFPRSLTGYTLELPVDLTKEIIDNEGIYIDNIFPSSVDRDYFYYYREDIEIAHTSFIPFSIHHSTPTDGYSVGQYNQVTLQYLLEQDSLLFDKLQFIEDSLFYLKAEQYIESHTINLDKITVPSLQQFPKRIQQRFENNKIEFEGYSVEYLNSLKKESSKYNTQLFLEHIDTSSDFEVSPKFWMLYHYEEVLVELIKRISDTTYIGLENSFVYPFYYGILEFEGTPEDIKIIAGRTNYLLTYLTNENFGCVTRNATLEYLQKLQNRWIYWLLHIDEYQNPISFKIPYEETEFY